MLKAQSQAFYYQAYRTFWCQDNKGNITAKKRKDLSRIQNILSKDAPGVQTEYHGIFMKGLTLSKKPEMIYAIFN